MTTATGPRATPAASATRSTLRRALAATWTTSAWFWVVVLVGAGVGTGILAGVNGTVDIAVVALARQGAIWFPFALMIGYVTGTLRAHVAAGITRRTFGRATLLAALVLGAAHTVVLVVLVLVERAVHTASGWDARIVDTPLPGAGDGLLVLLVALGPTLVLGNLSGLLVAVVYLRAGGWWGTLALPLTVGPLLLVVQLNAAGGGLLEGLPVVAAATWHVVAGAVAGVLVAAAYTLLVRRAVVRTA